MSTSRALFAACILATVALPACQAAPPFQGDPYGEPLTLTEATPVSTILADPEAWVGQRVLIRGEVREVCEKKGCWMDIAHPDGLIQVKVTDDVIVFPVSARGRAAVVEGTVEALALTAEEAFAAAAHRAEEQGEPFDSTAVFQPTTTYRIQGLGAVIMD